MKRLNLTAFLNRFAKNEEGSALLIFGLFVAIVVIGLFTFTQPVSMGFAWQTEARSKLEEYSTILTKEYTTLWQKLNNCQGTDGHIKPNCGQNADDQARVFARPLSEYDAGWVGVGADGNMVADMKSYLQNAAQTQTARTNFQAPSNVTVGRSCPQGRVVLTFTLTAPQFNSYWSSSAKNINVAVSRQTEVPCTAKPPVDPTCTGTECSPTENGAGEACKHSIPKTAFTAGATTIGSATDAKPAAVVTSTVNTLANFVVSLDATSKATIGDDRLKRLAKSLNGPLSISKPGAALATGLIIGNFPMMHGGAPACETKGGTGASTLGGSGSCYDVAADYTDVATKPRMADTVKAIPNTSRKTEVKGELIAQHTRICPSNKRVWTYETKQNTTCYEQKYQTVDIRDTHYVTDAQWDADKATYTTLNDTDANAYCVGKGYSLGAEAGSGQYTFGTTYYNDALCPGNNDGSGNPLGNECKTWQKVANCIERTQDDKPVYQGVWYQSCKSPELASGATSASAGIPSDPSYYRSPADLLKLKATLVADLDGLATTKRVTLEGAPVAGNRAKDNGTVAANPSVYPVMKSLDAVYERSKMNPLHIKNTERQFIWACDKGPKAGATRINNSGNLGSPYGVRYNASKELLDGTTLAKTSVATAANENIGCSIPSLGTIETSATTGKGRMLGTLDGYDVSLTRSGCTSGSCDVPEGMYSVVMAPGANTLDNPNGGISVASGSMLPSSSGTESDSLKTTWQAQAGDTTKWAWSAIGNVSSSGAECPRASGSLACTGGEITAANGTKYCKGYQYDTVQHLKKATCGADGSLCPNIASYIWKTDSINWLQSETLNVGTVAMERRVRADTSGAPESYQCTLDRASENNNSSYRANYVKNAGGTTTGNKTSCDWKTSPYYCTNGVDISYTGTQVESLWADDTAANKRGVFSLTPSNFSSTGIQIGDKEDHVDTTSGVQTGVTPTGPKEGTLVNYRSRNMKDVTTPVEIKSLIDSAQNIIPLQVQALEPVHYANSDYAPDNIPLKNTGDTYSESVLGQIGQGYEAYDILPWHNGNQCALLRAGARALWKADSDSSLQHTKILVYIGALPNVVDTTVSTSKVLSKAMLANHTAGTSTTLPGTYNSTDMKLSTAATTTAYATDTALRSAFLSKCVTSFKVEPSTVPFIITALPSTAVAADYRTLVSELKTSTESSSTEACKRPYCVLSDTDGFSTAEDIDGVMTPETCAAKLWQCINPSSSK